MSQQELADAIGVTKFVIGTWEREDTKLPLDKACEVAKVLNCTLDQLAGRDQLITDENNRKSAEEIRKLRKRTSSYTYEVVSLDKQLDAIQKKLDKIRGSMEQ